ncbi:MAG TPA: hypothetical protein VFI82_13560 [Terriglobales bacterium]|jgi:hypothetical protein|nr:hypothetical protein [Terriglobales bacterium]
MADVRLKDELEKMAVAKEPLLPIEQKLIWYTFGAGVILLFVLVFISRAYV